MVKLCYFHPPGLSWNSALLPLSKKKSPFCWRKCVTNRYTPEHERVELKLGDFWWFQPIWNNICVVKLDHLPKNQGENSKKNMFETITDVGMILGLFSRSFSASDCFVGHQSYQSKAAPKSQVATWFTNRVDENGRTTLPELTAKAPENRRKRPKRKRSYSNIFQPSIFRDYVSFRECSWWFLTTHLKNMLQVKMGIFPILGMKIKNGFETTT